MYINMDFLVNLFAFIVLSSILLSGMKLGRVLMDPLEWLFLRWLIREYKTPNEYLLSSSKDQAKFHASLASTAICWSITLALALWFNLGPGEYMLGMAGCGLVGYGKMQLGNLLRRRKYKR